MQAERDAKAQEVAASKEKKKPIRYPTEDLDVVLTDKEKKAGAKTKRPVPNKHAVPLNETPGAGEMFLMTWNFLVVYGHVLSYVPALTLTDFLQTSIAPVDLHHG